MKPLVSIIIPVKNGSNFLQEALNHIKRQQVDTEMIVINDASTDNTAEIAAANGCIVINHKVCKGQVAAKNTGVHKAQGTYIMFHDHDDMMRDGALKGLLEAMDAETTAVMGMVKDFYTSGLTEEQKHRSPIKAEPYHGLFTGAVLTRREAFEIIGDFSESINAGEIMEWEHRLSQNGLIIKKVDLVTCDRRIHATNYGKTNREKEFRDYAAVLRARILNARQCAK